MTKKPRPPRGEQIRAQQAQRLHELLQQRDACTNETDRIHVCRAIRAHMDAVSDNSLPAVIDAAFRIARQGHPIVIVATTTNPTENKETL